MMSRLSVPAVDTLTQRRNEAAGAKRVLPNLNEARRHASPHPLKSRRAEANSAPGSGSRF
jgi:hypothetical protein